MLSGWYKSMPHIPGHLRLLGKTCLICGVSTEVAATVARVFAVEGCKILAADESRNDLRKLVSDIQEDGGFALPYEASPRRPENLIRALSTSRFNRPDIIIDCWSWGQRRVQIAVADSTQVPEPFSFCPHSLQLLVARVAPTISPNVLRDELQEASFPFASRILSLAAKHAGEVRLNAVCFGMDLTVPPDNLGMDIPPAVASHNGPTANHASLALQIAYATLFLASDESRFVNGISIDVGHPKDQALTVSGE